MSDPVFKHTNESQEPLVDIILSAVLSQGAWLVYYKHPISAKSARIEIYQDLLKDWSLVKYSQTRKTQRFFKSFDETVHLAFKWMQTIEQEGLIKLVEKRGAPKELKNQLQKSTTIEGDFSGWMHNALQAFTLHNDWVDMATCLGLSADEYVDGNWNRFRAWLDELHDRPHSDREIYAFGLAVWGLYRQEMLQ